MGVSNPANPSYRGGIVTTGRDGKDGKDGKDGLSAYELALKNGYVGSEADWLDSLIGPPGVDGTNGVDGIDAVDGFSPTVYVTAIDGGHRLTITDINGTQTVDILNGVTENLAEASGLPAIRDTTITNVSDFMGLNLPCCIHFINVNFAFTFNDDIVYLSISGNSLTLTTMDNVIAKYSIDPYTGDLSIVNNTIQSLDETVDDLSERVNDIETTIGNIDALLDSI